MSKSQAAQTFVAVLATALVSSGVLSQHVVSTWVPVVSSAIVLAASLGIHSIRPPKQ